MMAEYLLSISIGPVQGFIMAARRTRDFWMGSIILSEVAKATAKHLLEGPLGGDIGRLIFPAPCKSMDLEPIPIDEITKRAPVEKFSATNVLLCRVVVEDDVPDAPPGQERMRDIAADARRAANQRWREFARRALAAVESTTAEVVRKWLEKGAAEPRCMLLNADLWRCQYDHDDAIEFYAAWCREDTIGYAEARGRVVRLLGGRKALRDFEPWKCGASVPKSSLDGARESVRKRQAGPLSKPVPASGGLRIKDDEELDLIGLTKRTHFGSNDVRFPSVSRFAVDPWVRGVIKLSKQEPAAGKAWESLINACEKLGPYQIAPKRGPRDVGLFPWLNDFPFEGSLLFPTRHKELEEEAGSSGGIGQQLEQVCKEFKQLRENHRLDEPSPYLAVLAADGDRMGQMLSAIDSASRHRDISRCQSEFASEARDIVRKEYRGACAFAAADDLLAFLPVDQCIECADRLRQCFLEMVAAPLTGTERAIFVQDMTSQEVDSCGGVPTLSVGIAIGHFMEPLEDLLQYARDAERRAKNPSSEDKARGQTSRKPLEGLLQYARDAEHRAKNPRSEDKTPGQTSRNGLAVAVHARAGAPFVVRDNWRRGNDPVVDRLRTWTDADLNGAIAGKTPYDLRVLAREYLGIAKQGADGGSKLWDPDDLADALQRDALRVLGRKRGSEDAGAAIKDDLRRIIRTEVRTPDDLLALAHELVLGHWLAEAESLAMNARRRQGGNI